MDLRELCDALTKALDAKPSPGPWFVKKTEAGKFRITAPDAHNQEVAVFESLADAVYAALASPENIAALLQEIKSYQNKAEADLLKVKIARKKRALIKLQDRLAKLSLNGDVYTEATAQTEASLPGSLSLTRL